MQDYWQHLEAENIQRVKMWAAKYNFIPYESFTLKMYYKLWGNYMNIETNSFPGTQLWPQPTWCFGAPCSWSPWCTGGWSGLRRGPLLHIRCLTIILMVMLMKTMMTMTIRVKMVIMVTNTQGVPAGIILGCCHDVPHGVPTVYMAKGMNILILINVIIATNPII